MVNKRTSPETSTKMNLGSKKNSLLKRNYTKSQKTMSLKPSLEGTQNFFIKPHQSGVKQAQIKPSKYSEEEKTQEVSGNISSLKVDNIGKPKDRNIEAKNFNEKKPFDKKQYRFKKYSKKYKLQQWEEKRKNSLLHEYHQSLKNDDEPKFDVQKIYEQYEERFDENNVNVSKTDIPEQKHKKKLFLKPHERYQLLREEKQKKMEEFKQRREERENAILQAKKKRIEKNKKLSQKTKKGQPIMKYRMEMLLEQIEKSLKN